MLSCSATRTARFARRLARRCFSIPATPANRSSAWIAASPFCTATNPASDRNYCLCSRQVSRRLLHLPQVQLARAEHRKTLDAKKLVRARLPQVRQIGLREFFEARRKFFFRELV